eukprot:SAG22_NODE_5912_length_932_cov_1.188475_1_plen_41_part_10
MRVSPGFPRYSTAAWDAQYCWKNCDSFSGGPPSSSGPVHSG